MSNPDYKTNDDRNLAAAPPLHGENGGPQSVVIKVQGESDIGSARRAAARLAASAGLSVTDAGGFALVVTEAATNIARHGRDGFIILRDARHSGESYVEMVAIDRGQGISDITRALSDGYSTGGTAGKGLGAIKRMSAAFDIWSAPGAGTAVLARVRIPNAPNDPAGASAVICTAFAGDKACGDAWMIERISGGVLIALADGLGHGPDAATAADAAIGTIRRRKSSTLAEMFQLAHGALRSTRGAAVQIAIIDTRNGILRSAGVGNISASVNTHDASKSVPSHPGIVGHQMPRLHEITIPWAKDSLLTMHSDGLSTKWRLEAYPAIRRHDPALCASLLYRDFARERDDATVIVYRDSGEARLG